MAGRSVLSAKRNYKMWRNYTKFSKLLLYTISDEFATDSVKLNTYSVKFAPVSKLHKTTRLF